MDRANSFKATIPPSSEGGALNTGNAGQETADTTGNQSTPAGNTTELPEPSLSTRPKPTWQMVHGDGHLHEHSAGAAGSMTSPRRSSFHASVDKARASRLKAPSRTSIADLPKAYPAISVVRSDRKNKASAGSDSDVTLSANKETVISNWPGFVKKGTTARVDLRGKNDLLELVSVLEKNPDITALKISADFGCKHDLTTTIHLNSRAPLSLADPVDFSLLDHECFRVLLSSIQQIRSIDLSGCGLSEKNFIDLSVFIKNQVVLQALTLGGGDLLSTAAQEALAAALAAGSSLRELVLENLFVESASIPSLLHFSSASAGQTIAGQSLIEGIRANGRLESISLLNLKNSLFGGPVFSFNQVTSLFGAGSSLRAVSFAGTSLGFDDVNSADKQSMENHGSTFGPVHPQELLRRAGQQEELPVIFGEKLEVLDLSRCSLTREQIHTLIDSVPIGSSLTTLTFDESEIDKPDAEALQKKLLKNRAHLLKDGANAYHLLVSNSVYAPPYWPREINEMLAVHTPVADLISLSDVLVSLPRSSDSSTEEKRMATSDTLTTTTTTLTTTTLTTTTLTTTTTATPSATATITNPAAGNQRHGEAT